MKLNFKDWLQNEIATASAAVGGAGGTYTGNIAKFSLPIGIGAVTRKSPSLITVDDLEKKKRKKKVKF